MKIIEITTPTIICLFFYHVYDTKILFDRAHIYTFVDKSGYVENPETIPFTYATKDSMEREY